jgi:DNA-binding MarR family transcriptional regulator
MSDKIAVVELPCACASLRRATRIVTQFYDDSLRAVDLTTPQFTLLQTLSQADNISQKQLADILAIDSTTLTRTLAPLRRKGWIHSEAGDDRRQLRLALTLAGKRQFKRAMPYWEHAQKHLRDLLGPADWGHVLEATRRIARLSA